MHIDLEGTAGMGIGDISAKGEALLDEFRKKYGPSDPPDPAPTANPDESDPSEPSGSNSAADSQEPDGSGPTAEH